MRSMSAPIRRSRPEFLSRNRDPVYVLGGLLYILGGILLVIYMFISGGSVMSEEDDIIGRAVERAGSQIHEWLPPPSINTTTAKLESADKLLAMHRFIITLRVEEAGDHHAMEEQLRALAAADYSTCPCPVDVEVLVPTPRDATEREAYRPILAMLHHYRWKRGRFAIRALPPHMDVDELSRLWQPQSEWEMWVLLEKDAMVSSEWMKWLAAAINTYVLATPSVTAGLPPVVDAAAAPKTGGDGWSTRTQDEWRVTTPRPSAAPQAMMGISLHRPLTVMPLSADARRHHPTGIDLLAESIRNDPFLLQQPGHYGMVWLPASWTTYQEWLLAHGTPTAEAGSTLSSSMWASLSTFMFGTQRYVLFPNFCAHLVQRVDAADEKKSSQQGNALELPEASQLKAYNADVVEVMRTH